jgi:hypothetical protein
MHAEADFVLIEIIDQCVRQGPGGRLAEFYSRVHEMDPASRAYWTAFIAERTGERLDRAIPAHSSSSLSNLLRSRLATVLTNPVSLRPKALARRFRLKIHQLGLRLLLPEFRRQNVSLAPIGERHCWLWDFHQLADALNTAGFVSVVRQTHLSSRINEFPFYPLDADLNDAPRMGRLSMYVEACVSGR